MRALLLPLALILAACAGAAPESGVSGVVLAGPQCPVIRAGSPCPDRPISVRFDIVGQVGQGRVILTVTSGDDGRFRQLLPPGRYTIEARQPDRFPVVKPISFSVEAGRFTEIGVRADTGIR